MARSNSNSDSNKSDTQVIKRPEAHPPARSQPRQRRIEEHGYRVLPAPTRYVRAPPQRPRAQLQTFTSGIFSAAATANTPPCTGELQPQHLQRLLRALHQQAHEDVRRGRRRRGGTPVRRRRRGRRRRRRGGGARPRPGRAPQRAHDVERGAHGDGAAAQGRRRGSGR